jgi:hypothetical protein
MSSTSSKAMLKDWILEIFPFRKAKHYSPYLNVNACVCWSALSLEPADRLSRYMTVTHF